MAELVDAKVMGGQRAIGEEPRKLRVQVRVLSWLHKKQRMEFPSPLEMVGGF